MTKPKLPPLAFAFRNWQQQQSNYRNAYGIKLNYSRIGETHIVFRDFRVNWAWEAFRAGYKYAQQEKNHETERN